MSTPDKTAQLFEQYIKTRKVVIADENSSTRTSLAKTLIQMGAKASNVIMASTIEVAEEEITKHTPHVVIVEYQIGKGSGLNLLTSQRENRPEAKDCLFVLVTGNTSQSAVARAAEEEVDVFVLKPYTADVLRQTIIKAALAKLYPTDYVKTVNEGKELLLAGKIEESIPILEKAIGMDSKPALACFYHGQAQLMKQAAEGAEGDYAKGLAYNKIHYKCMIGLFELFMSQKKHEKAYEVVKKVSQYFPANPKRLTQVLRLAILTKSYEDIERYYQIFTNLDQRNEEMIKYSCAALVVTGKFYLQQKFPSRALELFQKAGATAGGRTKILREIITTLVSNDLEKEAKDYLKRFSAESQKGADFLTMNYIVSDRFLPAANMIEMGRKLVHDGIQDPLIYKTLIRRSMEGKFKDSAESFAQDAAKLWPDQKDEFLTLVKEADVKTTA